MKKLLLGTISILMLSNSVFALNQSRAGKLASEKTRLEFCTNRLSEMRAALSLNKNAIANLAVGLSVSQEKMAEFDLAITELIIEKSMRCNTLINH